MPTTNLTAHQLLIEQRLSTSDFYIVADGLTSGRKVKRFRIKCDGPAMVVDLARQLHIYLKAEQKKINEANAAMKGEDQ